MRLGAWLARRRLERELREEMRAHREMLEADYRAGGMTPEDARRAAAHKLGNATVFLEQSRDEWSFAWLEAVLKDLRFAWRLTRRQPLAAAVAVITIALGVGANTAVVSVLETVLLNPAGVRHASDVVVPRVRFDKLNMWDAEASGAEFRDLESMPDAFAAVAASEGRNWTSQAGGEAVRLVGRAVTPDFFAVFRERPALGRWFVPEERDAVILSDRIWRAQFAADPKVPGRTMDLDGRPHRIVGVAPASFRFPVTAQVFVPLTLSPRRLQARGNNMNLTLFARLRDGVSLRQAAGRVDGYVDGLRSGAGGGELRELGYAIDLKLFSRYVAGDLRRPLWLLWAAALILLLTACANIAVLLLARAAGRRREIAIRLSVGATPWQIARQLLVESTLMGVLGGVAGILLATGAVALLGRLAVPHRELLGLVSMDYRLLAYGLLLAVASGVFCGLTPGVQLLRESRTAHLARHARRRFQNVFVTAEVCGAFLLVVITALLARSLWMVERISPGFDTRQLTTAFLVRPAKDSGFLGRLEETLRSTPGVESAALAMPIPFTTGGLTSTFGIRNRERRQGEPEFHAEAYFISADYLRTLRIPLLRGRNLAASDTAGAPRVCLIDARLAERFFPGGDPIGQEMMMYGWARIVGVVASIRGTTLEEGSLPTAYYPLAQAPFLAQAGVVVRSRAPAGGVIRHAVRRANSAVPVYDIKTMEERVAESLGIRRALALLLLVFGGVSLLLATVGIYGVAAQVVAERTQEIGIRMALGAGAGRILSRFMREGVLCGLAGVALGLLALGNARGWLTGLLYQVDASDPKLWGAAALGVLAVLCLAVWWPARRAAHIDPQRALRYE